MILKKRIILILIFLIIVIILNNYQNSMVINNNDLEILNSNLVLVNLSFRWLPFIISPHNAFKIYSIFGIINLYLCPIYQAIDFETETQIQVDKDQSKDEKIITIVDILNSKIFEKEVGKREEREDIYYKYIGYDVYIKYNEINLKNREEIKTTKFIRNIDIFNNVKDLRPYYSHFSPNSLFTKNSIHFLKISPLDCINYLNFLKKFNSLKYSKVLKSNQKNFKIFQISDLHYLNGKIDYKTENFLINSILNESPNLIVLNGDIFNFLNFNFDNFSSMLLNTFNIFINLKIPFIINFGDSDYLSLDQNKIFLKFLSNLPYCLNSFDDVQNLHGLTNYNFLLKNNENKSIGVISILDTFENKLKNSQINQLYRFNSELSLIDPEKSQSGTENSVSDTNPTDSNLFKLSFIHYPLPNFRPLGKFKIIGNYIEKNPLITTTDSSFINDFIHLGYNVILASHEHLNDGCILHETKERQNSNDNVNAGNDGDGNGGSSSSENGNGGGEGEGEGDVIWLCYSSVSGFQGKTTIENYDRKLRVFEILDNRLLSWKISEKSGKGFDYQLIKGN